MVRQLVVVAGPDKGRAFPLPEADALLLGRSRATESRLSDPYTSRVHCQVAVRGDDVVVTDSDSAGGTFVNDQRLTGPRLLKLGDVIRIGQTELRYVSGDEADTLPPAAPAAAPAARSAAPPAAELIGQTFSRYEITAVLAKGQSGTVFHARDTEQDRPVALKALHPSFATDDEQRERFIRAMKTVLPLRHPNLVTVLAAGRSGPHCWVAMEYVEGENLAQVVQRIGTAGMLDWRRTLRAAIHVARALEHAHGQQIIHRNITPMNIIERRRDRVARLGDLMLAKALEGTHARDLTQPGTLLGEINYLSPERTRAGIDVDARSDLFSLGGVMYALLTGRPPFADVSPVETIKKIRAADPERPKKYHMAIPDILEGVVLKLLAKRPEDRYPSATALLGELERIARFHDVEA